MMFTKNKYNIIIEEGNRIHSSDKLLKSMHLELKTTILRICIEFITQEIDLITLEYCLKAINPLILPETFQYLQQTPLYQILKEIISSQMIFSVKASALNCLMNLFINSDSNFSISMIEDGFFNFIDENCQNLSESIAPDIINSILRFLQLNESVEGLDKNIIYGDTNIREFLDDIVNSDSELTDESGFPLKDIANSILQQEEDE